PNFYIFKVYQRHNFNGQISKFNLNTNEICLVLNFLTRKCYIMSEMIYILQSVLLPIFIMIVLGFILQKKFTLDLKTLAKLNIYVFVPGFIFVKFYKTNFEIHLLLYIVAFFIIYIFILFLVGKILTLFKKRDKGEATTLTNSVLFFNSVIYGVPVNDLLFKGDPLSMSVQVIVLSLQNIFTFSYGIFAIQSAQIGKLKAMLGYFKMPVLYALLFAITLNY